MTGGLIRTPGIPVSDSSPPELVRSAFRPLVIVPDANVFARRAWVDHLIEEALADHIFVCWSPKTIEELGRLRLWLWLRRALRTSGVPEGSSAWKSLWSRYSTEAHRWFAQVSQVCQVVEDREPHEPAWSELIRDPNDAWLWNAARRIDADLVVTMNLRDAPPADTTGVRRHERTSYIHPDVLMIMLDLWRVIRTAGEAPIDLHAYVDDVVGPIPRAEALVVTAYLRAILDRIVDEDTAEQR
jgi:hypothetical protein